MRKRRKYLWINILLPVVLLISSAHFLMPSSHTYFVGEGMEKSNISGFYHGIVEGEYEWKEFGKGNSKTGAFEIGDKSS